MRSSHLHFFRVVPTFAVGFFLMAGNVAAFVPIFGDPEYNPSTQIGYQAALEKPYPFERNLVNNTGTAVATLQKSTSSTSQFRVPLKWPSTSAPPVELQLPASYNSPTSFSWSYAINDSGQVVGAAHNDNLGERPVRWDASGVGTELDNLGTRFGSNFTWGQAYAINNTGTVVGYSERWVGGIYYDRAARWNAHGTAITELGELPHEPLPPNRYAGLLFPTVPWSSIHEPSVATIRGAQPNLDLNHPVKSTV
jgi:hypothetical protein